MKPKLIYLEWCDAIESNAGWQPIEVMLHWANNDDWVVAQCGFLLDETEEYILFASQMTDFQGDNSPQFGSVNKIPKTWVRCRIDLSKNINPAILSS